MKKKFTEVLPNEFLTLSEKLKLEQAKIKSKDELRKILEELNKKEKTFHAEKVSSATFYRFRNIGSSI